MHKRVKVCIRVRPASKDHAGIRVSEPDKTISVLHDAASGHGTCFKFDDVLASSVSQEQVFERAAREATESVLHGYNGTVMAYGQTGAGKTFTMSGGKTSFADRGICARSIALIFASIQAARDFTYSVRVSYIEIYNEQLYDLLDFNAGENQARDLVVQENDKGQTFVKGLSKPLVETEEAALDLLFQGDTNRTIAEHCLNNASTRSHCIFSLHIEKRSADDSTKSPLVVSKLNLVDLAGSERMKKTQVTGTMLKETMHINKSLTFLEQVVIALGDQKREHIPYRQTTLTNLLKDSLGGNCRTLLVACVWPDESQNDQTIATLKFATRMMRVKTSAVVNSADPSTASVKKYVDEIKRLKSELALHDTLAGRSHVSYDAAIPPETEAEMKAAIQAYVADASLELPIVNVVQIRAMLRLFRDVALTTTVVETKPPPPDEPQDEDDVPLNRHDLDCTPLSDDELQREYAELMQTQLDDAKQNFRKAKKRVVQCANDVNVAKSEIDAVTKALSETDAGNEDDRGRHVQALQLAKKAYRTAFDALGVAKAEMSYIQKAKDHLLASAASDFVIWKEKRLLLRHTSLSSPAPTSL
ncbi:hypothetical protein SDRG_08336 [Saprolegnia diclina VS20]|uniref:Kinesin-like protein n=1 Tax=Saprolegnia diclina (strain VS20) TaxID=1156394 RepID=T0RUU2_SAPDV|nr:hypothetical protein SDRG_08336 [Saprolegnia diclina VS20]EQC34127.1 hypothetical protein SDRG_08336 [Saprolegnia diclina VS20]|eukprot:XP_008612439.1 hypothetical protein SDRG_08336 [Saprolegnia diclina VS20]